MFCTFAVSFDEDILAYLVWQLFWLLFSKIWSNFSQSPGCPAQYTHRESLGKVKFWYDFIT
jgi:purine-cytosine permease-like protein